MNSQNTEIDTEFPENGKRPQSLKILLILSSIYIVITLSGTIQALMNGPLTQDQLEQETSALYSSVTQLEEQGIGLELVDMARVMIDSAIYLNNEAFVLTHSLKLIMLLIGAASIVLMYQYKKIGFHIYLLYSLLPIAVMYITTPQELILNASIVLLVFIGGFFALLYGRNLKYLK